tara:strand:+ start:452 stop:1297 length:846 start_codon:yes stop_codon:yes gene_type:complete
MPFDFTNFEVPENLNFSVEFEPTKVSDKKYVINADTGKYLGIVGKGFTCASHGDFYRRVYDTITENLLSTEIENAQFTWRSARNNAWSMLDITLPDMQVEISTDKHTTTLGNRIISLHGIDGSCSNQAFFGAIDFFCTNGQISGDYDKIRKKNTSNFTLDGFIQELQRARTDFYTETAKMQVWAQTSTKYVNIQSLLEEMISSKRKAEKMFSLYCAEASTRGHNKWALYSAFTNYASYADERNGFNLRNTGNDTRAISMFSREQEVSKWVSDRRFVELEAA